MKIVLRKNFLQSVDNLIRRYLAIILFFSYRFIRIQLLVFFAFSLIKQKSTYKKPITGLAFGRQIFDADTNAINKYSRNISIDTIHKSYFFMYLDYLSLFDTYDLVTYLNEGNIRQSVKSHLKTILAHLVKKNGYKFIIASNYDYIECVELPSVCKTLNIPYIILYKEGLNLNTGVATTYTVKNNSVFPFLGDKILTYNQSVRDAFVNSNNHSVAPEKVIACGVPRFDEIIRSENNDTEDTYEAVLFSSYPIDKIGLYKNQHKNTIKKYIDSFHMDFIKLATKMPTKKFLIKTKAAEYYFSYVKKMVDVHGTLPNLTITNHGNAQEYIAKSEVICGFNSTTLIESCLMKKPTVSVKIPNITSSEEENLLKLNLNTHFWDKPGWFENFFMDKNSKTSNKSNNPIDKQYGNLIFSLDGNSSLRVESEILKEVSKFQ